MSASFQTIVRFRVKGLALVLAAGLVSGCATTNQIDSEVKSFNGPAAIALTPGNTSSAPGTTNAFTVAPARGSFRFERLPSQQKDAAQAAKIEAWAQPALEKAGFTRDDAKATYAVQLSAYSMEEPRGFDYNYARFSFYYPGYDRLVYYRGRLISFGPGIYAPAFVPDTRNVVSGLTLVVRNVASGQVVYETSAVNEQRRFDAARVFPALAIAAMDGYPVASPEKRKVSVTVPNP